MPKKWFILILVLVFLSIVAGEELLQLVSYHASRAPTQPTTKTRQAPMIADGKYKTTEILCNGLPPKGNFSSAIGYPFMLFEGNHLVSTYQYPNCEVSVQYNFERTGDARFQLTPTGTVTCSDSKTCGNILDQGLQLKCGGPNTLFGYEFGYAEKSNEPKTYLLSVDQNNRACSNHELGSDPISIEITRQ